MGPDGRMLGGGCPLCTCLVGFVTKGDGLGEAGVASSSVEVGQVFETPPGMAETRVWPGVQVEAEGLTVRCRWAMPAHTGSSGAKALFLGGTGGVYSLGFVLSKEVQWYF